MAVTIDTPSARATVRYLGVSPYKIRQVLDLVRGLPVDDAIRVLQLCEKDAADSVLKLLDSAVANAEHNQQLPADELYLARIWCDEGPTRKSGQARARGRYFRVRKRTSHMTIILARYAPDEDRTDRRIDIPDDARRTTILHEGSHFAWRLTWRGNNLPPGLDDEYNYDHGSRTHHRACQTASGGQPAPDGHPARPRARPLSGGQRRRP